MAILGIDEVGRGPLAGPLVVGAVILPEGRPDWVLELRDSKKLTAKKREELSAVILERAVAAETAFVSAAEIDEIGISEALKKATRMVVKSVQGLHAPFSQIVIDGKVNFLKETALARYVSTLVKADDLIAEVAAASIIAKVARDRYMAEREAEFPGYGFSRNVGYGTKAHFEAIYQLGVCAEHRKSFEPCKSLVGFSRESSYGLEAGGDEFSGGAESAKKNTTAIGAQGEEAVCGYLVRAGHEIVQRNFRTKRCEIDIVSIKEERIYFTEVKYRKNRDFGGGLSAISAEKLRRMRFSAESFLAYRKEFAEFSPLLAVAAVEGDFRNVEWFELGAFD